ncbi:helix-turn-helix domain-containing protein [Mucilaginibacter aquariorum]|uniref:Helix-turn-helix domain-containing protein n=1 Tax=Mucilaginibacter aquariorum TaxID=2967225 RepID=A0ABT1T914_9SPHI|nr:helix-turn-helix domain-containing protein [Mucilaginibacter aquariorum]MCQ6961104.1 helix-turn-helix domain-containing protein [Mucilaginibacter aquariorum]
MTSNELVTKEDLEVFGNKLLEKIELILQPGKAQSKQWLKSKDVRKLLNISPGTLQNLRINGTLSYTKIGGMMYYKLEDIHKVLEGSKH